MSNATRHIRHGVGSVRPYLYGRLDMLELVKRAFGAVELEHLPVGNGAHVEAKIGDSMLVMEVSDPPHPGGNPPPSMYTSMTLRRGLQSRAGGRRNPDIRPRRQALPGTRRRREGQFRQHLVHRNLHWVSYPPGRGRACGAGEGAYSVVDACALTRRSRTHVDLSRGER